jgi:predicted alpha/beta superfamily hydrolase
MKLLVMKFSHKVRFLILISCCILTGNTLAQETVIINDSVFSHVLNEQRKIRILLPEEYNPASDDKFDVVYLLDGEAHFDDFSFIYEFARKEKLLPPLILVAILNTYTDKGSMRDRDFLPLKTPGNEKGGGADNFMAFLRDELIPYIGKKYPSGGDNSLYGHSLGGLFSFYVMLKEPDLFSNYYCSDPAFPWNDRYIISMATTVFRNSADLDLTLWINGNEDTYRNVGIQKMDSVLQEYAPGELRWKVAIYPDETHMSVRLKGIYDGLKFTYKGYNSQKMVEFHPNNGSLLKGIPAPVFLNGSFPDVYYTTDGSEPDTSSRKAPQMIEIEGPAELRVRWIGENRKYINTAKGKFEISDVWPALQQVKNIKAGGMRYSYYEGNWNALPDFKELDAVEKGIADSSFNPGKLPAGSNFGCVFEGYIKVEEEGYYMFALSSSDGSKFFINGREIINNDGLHGNEWYKSYLVPLQKGFYPVRLEYFVNTGKPNFSLIYLMPDTHETVNLSFQMMYFK